jgi:hypothetical protein
VNGAGEPQHSRPLWVASIVTPVAALGAGFVVLCALTVANGGELGSAVLEMLRLLAVLGLPLATGAMFLIGLPLVLLMRSQRMLTAENVCVAATVIATVSLFGILGILGAWLDVEYLVFTPVIGAFAGAVFCLVAGIPFRRRTP